MGADVMTVLERFWAKVDVPIWAGSCWTWLAALNTAGYGHFQTCVVGVVRAHIMSYNLMYGPVPDGLVLDHLCRNRACVNPTHLEPVTNAENIRRGVSFNGAKMHCPKGHPYDKENTKPLDGGARRDCRTCVRTAGRIFMQKKREAMRGNA